MGVGKQLRHIPSEKRPTPPSVNIVTRKPHHSKLLTFPGAGLLCRKKRARPTAYPFDQLRIFWISVVGERQFVQVDRIRRLLGIAVLLIVDGHSMPARRRSVRVVLIEIGGLSIQSDRLVQHFVV